LERILANENLKNAYLAEMCELRELYFNSEYLDPRLDAIQALIQSAVYSDDNKMYSNADFAANFDNNLNTGGPGGGGGPGGSLYGLHSFVADRSAFVANEVDCTGLGTSGLSDQQPFAVYPNPTNGRVTLAWNVTGERPTIEVYDLRGQLVHTISTASRQSSYDLNLPPGLYVLNCPEWGADAAVKLHITP
ncbi:MAG: T9SS type A sorting domain-containing protein, partial [Flavobacteriales bacterium]